MPKILVNGVDYDLDQTAVNYYDILRLAAPMAHEHPTIQYTGCTLPDSKTSGVMLPGQIKPICDGMEFDVADTSKA